MKIINTEAFAQAINDQRAIQQSKNVVAKKEADAYLSGFEDSMDSVLAMLGSDEFSTEQPIEVPDDDAPARTEAIVYTKGYNSGADHALYLLFKELDVPAADIRESDASLDEKAELLAARVREKLTNTSAPANEPEPPGAGAFVIDRETIGKNIQRLIGESGYARKDIAAFLDCSTSAVSAWCLGTYYPRLETLSALSKILGAPIEAFFRTHVEEEPQADPSGGETAGDSDDEAVNEPDSSENDEAETSDADIPETKATDAEAQTCKTCLYWEDGPDGSICRCRVGEYRGCYREPGDGCGQWEWEGPKYLA